MHKVLFICLGNICRSPFAEAAMKHYVHEQGLDKDFIIDSAGIGGWHVGQRPDRRMVDAAWQRGYHMNHFGRQVCRDDFEIFDLIIGMDDSNIDSLKRIAPTSEAESKIHKMTEYISDDFRRQHPNVVIDHVPDPYYGGTAGFYYAIDLIEDACQGLLNELNHSLRGHDSHVQ